MGSENDEPLVLLYDKLENNFSVLSKKGLRIKIPHDTNGK